MTYSGEHKPKNDDELPGFDRYEIRALWAYFAIVAVGVAVMIYYNPDPITIFQGVGALALFGFFLYAIH